MTATTCSKHGIRGIGLVCNRIAAALLAEDVSVGFFWGDDVDTARPDAWCHQCEQELLALAGRSSEHWFLTAEFKPLCETCWDEAKELLLTDPALPT